MPVAPAVSYPGVYIQEVESDVRTIVPVETATTAFIGRALRGPVNEPRICNSYADFERLFGGLWLDSSLGYAVKQFFLNGGSKAVIVRLFNPGPEQQKHTARLSIPGLHPAAQQVFEAVEKAAALPDPTAGDLKKAAERAFTSVSKAGDEALGAAKAVKAKVDQPPPEAKTPEAVLDAARRAAADQTDPAAWKVFNDVAKMYDAVADLTPETGLAELKNAAKKAYEGIDKDVAAAKSAATKVKQAVEDKAGGKDDAVLKESKIQDVLDAAKNAPSDGEQAGIVLTAKFPGAWGNELRARVTHPDEKLRTDLEKKYEQYDVKFDSLFNLTVHDRKTGATEHFDNLTLAPGPRRVDKVLEHQSQLVAFDGTPPDDSPRPNAHQQKPAEKSKSVWEDDKCCAEATGGTDGHPLDATDLPGSEAEKSGIYALAGADIFNLLCIPLGEEGQDVYKDVLTDAAAYCEKRRAMLLVDPPLSWNDKDKAKADFPTVFPGSLGSNAAIFFPRLKAPNPLRDNQVEGFPPCGAIAGIFARTDAARGVWKAPAGLEATLRGVVGLTVPLTDAENGELNPRGINCLRQMPAAGYVVWGARTTVGDDQLANQWKYIPVRRTALFIEETLYRNTKWAVFEPNDEPLWSQLRLNIGVFMHGLFRQGAFQGRSPKEAYFVKCDSSTTTQADIDRGIVNVVVGFAPLKPAEFVVLYIQQKAGQLEA